MALFESQDARYLRFQQQIEQELAGGERRVSAHGNEDIAPQIAGQFRSDGWAVNECVLPQFNGSGIDCEPVLCFSRPMDVNNATRRHMDVVEQYYLSCIEILKKGHREIEVYQAPQIIADVMDLFTEYGSAFTTSCNTSPKELRESNAAAVGFKITFK